MNNFSETVRNSADIIKVVSEYVSLKAAGSSSKGFARSIPKRRLRSLFIETNNFFTVSVAKRVGTFSHS